MLLAAETSHAVSFPLLTAAILVPLVGALVLALLPRTRTELIRPTALLFATTTGAFTLWMLGAFDRHDAGFQFEVQRTWIEEFGIRHGWRVRIFDQQIENYGNNGVRFHALLHKHD